MDLPRMLFYNVVLNCLVGRCSRNIPFQPLHLDGNLQHVGGQRLNFGLIGRFNFFYVTFHNLFSGYGCQLQLKILQLIFLHWCIFLFFFNGLAGIFVGMWVCSCYEPCLWRWWGDMSSISRFCCCCRAIVCWCQPISLRGYLRACVCCCHVLCLRGWGRRQSIWPHAYKGFRIVPQNCPVIIRTRRRHHWLSYRRGWRGEEQLITYNSHHCWVSPWWRHLACWSLCCVRKYRWRPLASDVLCDPTGVPSVLLDLLTIWGE